MVGSAALDIRFRYVGYSQELDLERLSGEMWRCTPRGTPHRYQSMPTPLDASSCGRPPSMMTARTHRTVYLDMIIAWPKIVPSP